MKNYQIKGNELFVYMPEKQKLVKIDEGEIKQNTFFISVKHKDAYTLYCETDFGLVIGPKNVKEFYWVRGIFVFRWQSMWNYGGFVDSEQLLGIAYEEMPGVYRKARGELSVIIRQPYDYKIPFTSGYFDVAVKTVKYKNLKKIEEYFLLEQAGGSFIVLEKSYNCVQYSKVSYIQYNCGEGQSIVLAKQSEGNYQKIYEGENLFGLKNVIIRHKGEDVEMLQYKESSKQLEVIAEGTWTTIVEDSRQSSEDFDEVLTIEGKEWWVKDNYLKGIKFDPNAKAEKQRPENWSFWKWFSIGRYFKS